MFEEIDFYPQEALGVLSIEKLLYDHFGIVTGAPIDSDYLYACMDEAISEIVQDVAYGYNDGWAMNIFHIVFPSMRSFYSLCREHCRLHRVSFKRNPYVRAAAQAVNEHMENIDDYDVNWRLCTPKKEYQKNAASWLCIPAWNFTSRWSWWKACAKSGSFTSRQRKSCAWSCTARNPKIHRCRFCFRLYPKGERHNEGRTGAAYPGG